MKFSLTDQQSETIFHVLVNEASERFLKRLNRVDEIKHSDHIGSAII